MVASTVELIEVTPELLLQPEIQASRVLEDTCREIIATYPAEGQSRPWIGYLVHMDGEMVGTCAFKGEPRAGRVEIAYSTFPGYEREEVLTAMVSELVRLSGASGVKEVVAHTVPEQNVSTHALTKLGFRCEGVVERGDRGPVWEWRHKATPKYHYAKWLNWAALMLACLAGGGYILLATSGGEVAWFSWGLVALLMYNSGIGLGRERFSPRTQSILNLLSATAAIVFLVAFAASFT